MEPEVRHKPVRYYEIDLLRFLAALAVVLFHFAYRGYHANNLSPVEYQGLGEVFKYGYLGVELFFLISGYVVLMSAQGKTLGQFFTSRVMRLYPAFWVACTATFLVVHFIGPTAPNPLMAASWRDYAYNMTMLHQFFGVPDVDGVYWTLTVEIVYYFLIAILIGFGWMKHLIRVLTAWLAYCALAGPASSGSPFAFLLFPYAAPFFVAGMVFYLMQTNQGARWKLYGLLAASYLLALRGARRGLEDTIHAFQQPFSLVVVLLLVTAFFSVFWLIINRRINVGQAKWLGWAGAMTYPVYLLHHNIGYVVFQRLGGRVDKYLLLGGLLVLLLVSALLLHLFVERRFSKKLGQVVAALLARS